MSEKEIKPLNDIIYVKIPTKKELKIIDAIERFNKLTIQELEGVNND